MLYYYSAEVDRVYDGDTIFLNIDLGMSTFIKGEKIRLARKNTPELRGDEREEELKSRDFLVDLLKDKEMLLETIKDKKGKYGRYLGEIWVETGSGYENANDLLVKNGHAKYVSY